MPQFVMLTQLSSDFAPSAETVLSLGHAVSEEIRASCPKVRWLASYAVTGRFNYVDVFEAPDNEEAAKVGLIIRTTGHATLAEVMPATPWDRFKQMFTDQGAHNVHGRHERMDRSAGADDRGRTVDAVTEASEESFPASDPPAWTGTTASKTK